MKLLPSPTEKSKPDGYIYLACAYSHPDPNIREARFHRVNEAVATLMNEGYVVYSPITHNHPIAVKHSLPIGWNFWGRLDEVFIRHCHELWILVSDGWNESVGIWKEMDLAIKYDKLVRLLTL